MDFGPFKVDGINTTNYKKIQAKVFEGGDAHVQVHTDELPGDGELAEGEGSLIVDMTDFNILLIAKTRSDFFLLFHLTIRVKGPLRKVCAAAKHLILVGNAV